MSQCLTASVPRCHCAAHFPSSPYTVTLTFAGVQSLFQLTAAEFVAFTDYSVMVFSNIGNVDHRDTKFLPRFSPEAFTRIAAAVHCSDAFERVRDVVYSVDSGARLGWGWSSYYVGDTAATPIDEQAVARVTQACEQVKNETQTLLRSLSITLLTETLAGTGWLG